MLSSLTGTRLRLADVERLARVDASGRRPELEELLTRLTQCLTALSDAITQTYLSHLETSRHLTAFTPGPRPSTFVPTHRA